MLRACLHCGYLRRPDEAGPDFACTACGAVYAKMEIERAQQASMIDAARRTGDWRQVPSELLQRELAKIVTTTTEGLPGRRCEAVVSIVSGEYSYAFGAIFESVAGLLRNIAGSGKSGMTSRMLREGRAQALASMKLEALTLKADAVVGVRVDYEEFSGANNQGVIIVVASGTAVRSAPDST